MVLFFTISAIIALIFWLAGTFLLWRIPYCKKSDTDSALPRCSVIIPARNEESNIASLLHSLKLQTTQPGEVIVVNDQSTDDTASIAKQYGVRLIDITNKPGGWTGKTWACWQGAQGARFDPLIFLDADTHLSPGGVEKILHTWIEHSGMVTVQPYHIMKKGYEKLSAFFNIMILAGIGAFTPLRNKLKPSGSFGPCMACSRTDYFDTGGHKAARGTILENLSLGKIFLDAEKPVHCYGGKNTISFRMYPGGFKELIEGWVKGFATGASNVRPLFLVLTILWITGCFITFSGLLLAPLISISTSLIISAYTLLYVLCTLQVYWMLFRIGNFGVLSAVLFPVHALFFVFIFIRSYVSIFILKRVTWRGRTLKV